MVLVQRGQSRMIIGSRKAIALRAEAARGNAGAAKELKALYRKAKETRKEKTKIKEKIAKLEAKLTRKLAVIEELAKINASKLAVMSPQESVTEGNTEE